MFQTPESRQPVDSRAARVFDGLRLLALKRILARGRVAVRFQPIVDLASGEVDGLEALSSFESGNVFVDTDSLFAFAERSRFIVELERICRRQALLEAAHPARRGGKLFLNCSAHAFSDPLLLPDLIEGAAFLGLEPRRIVLELTERVGVADWPSFLATLGGIRRAGFGFAVDDFGSGCSSADVVVESRPDYVKLDRALVRALRLHPAMGELLAETLAWVGETGAEVIAEGIERPEDLAAVRRLGIRYAQGYLLGRPGLPLPSAASRA